MPTGTYVSSSTLAGIVCPKCSACTEVLETREKVGGIRRRRCCSDPSCGGRVTTLELVVPSHQALAGDDIVPISASALAKMIESLTKMLDESRMPCSTRRPRSGNDGK